LPHDQNNRRPHEQPNAYMWISAASLSAAAAAEQATQMSELCIGMAASAMQCASSCENALRLLDEANHLD
jgi:hypothetical protein